MEERKLIRLGNSSFAIALPKAWVDKAGLKKGDKVYILPNSNGELMISPEFKKGEGKKIEINTNSLDEYALQKELKSAYVRGYKEMHFSGKNNPSLKNSISELKSDLLSLEFVESEKDKIVVKDFMNIEEIDIGNFIRRMDNNIREMLEIVSQRIAKGKMPKSELENIRKIDDDVNKSYLLISRILILGLDNPSILSQLKTSSLDLFNRWWFSFNLEHIGDSLKTISKIMCNSEVEASNQIHAFLKQIIEIYSESMVTFYNSDKTQAISSMRKSHSLFQEHKKEEFKNIPHSKIAENLKMLQDACYQNLKMTLYMRT
ncbi:MAG: phosphate uptake regulator PhoU [Candidatus Pacearchaeota archaeon]|nr:phosphate uptake regulator PhoU [Candidatus Pacearchaeota archaeon]